ncbi:MAG: sulfurtransferase [Streptosporangiaceae bacterium]
MTRDDGRRGPDDNPLISAAGLTRRLAQPGAPVALLDVRWQLGGPPGRERYLAGHLPGAAYVDLDADLAAPPGSGAGGRHPLPAGADFAAAMSRAGLRAGQLAAVYDDGDATVAARLWWLLRYFGHDQVAVLDGGYLAWTAAGLAVQAGPVSPPPGNFAAGPGGGMAVLDDAGAARLARAGVLLDARAAARYRGETEPVDPVAGHIPGAVSAPAAGNTGADGKFRPGHELARRFAALGMPERGRARGLDGPPAVGAYCGSGVTAAQEVLALELAGWTAALYPGSWSAWCADPSGPVATGPEPG